MTIESVKYLYDRYLLTETGAVLHLVRLGMTDVEAQTYLGLK